LDGISTEASSTKLQAIMDEASKKMSSTPQGPALTVWIRLYTDAAILRSLADINAISAIQSLETLDHAIIICGLAGARLEMILSLITAIQRHYFPKPSLPFIASVVYKPFKREIQLLSSHHKIPSSSEHPSLITFQSNLADVPFIIRGYAQDWPAMREHPWWSAAYLRFVSGPGRIVPVEVGKDYRADEWTQVLMPWDDFLSTLDLTDQVPPQPSTHCYYLAQHNLLVQFPALRNDIVIPDYVYASMTSRDFPQYRPPGNDEQLVLNTWLGPGGTMSPAHTVRFTSSYGIYSFNHGPRILITMPSVSPALLFAAVAEWPTSTSSWSKDCLAGTPKPDWSHVSVSNHEQPRSSNKPIYEQYITR
jgi:lysine-specific demethylase 8